ncbi:hypothetical protein HK104_003038 [Borealophlyctis nickersoniae]|nr:hypothetical protein HK104_003038 [Borealophlyctis nickersoniae]
MGYAMDLKNQMEATLTAAKSAHNLDFQQFRLQTPKSRPSPSRPRWLNVAEYELVLTNHAMRKDEELGFNLSSIQETFENPTKIRPGWKYPDSYRVIRDDICLVGVPVKGNFVVITMYWEDVITPPREDQMNDETGRLYANEYFKGQAFTRVVDGVEKPYKESWRANLGKTLSKIAQHLTDNEKIRILDHHYKQQIDRNSRNMMKRYNKQQKLNAFKVLIQDPYTAYNRARCMEYAQGNVSQKMNKRQTAAYQRHQQLLKKVIHALGRVNWNTAHGVYQFQLLVVALIYLLAYRNRRLDLADTRLVDGEDVYAVLRENGIFIKRTGKTYEPEVLLEFKDERLINAIKTLVEIRRMQGKDHLFLKKDGDVALWQLLHETLRRVVLRRGSGGKRGDVVGRGKDVDENRLDTGVDVAVAELTEDSGTTSEQR